MKTIRLNRLDNKLTERGAKSGYTTPTNQPYTHTERETDRDKRINQNRERGRERVYTILLHFDHKMHHIHTPLFSSCMILHYKISN